MSFLPPHSDFTEILTSLSNLLLSDTLSCVLIPMVSLLPIFFFPFYYPYCVYSYQLWCALSQKSECSRSLFMTWSRLAKLKSRRGDTCIYLDGSKGRSI